MKTKLILLYNNVRRATVIGVNVLVCDIRRNISLMKSTPKLKP